MILNPNGANAMYFSIATFPAFAWALATRFKAEISGATAVEYALLAGSLALAIIVGVSIIGDAAVDLLTIATEDADAASEEATE